jgi:hypothetical protein
MSIQSPNSSDHFNATTLNVSTSAKDDSISEETQTTSLHMSPLPSIQAIQSTQVASYIRTTAVNNSIMGTHSNAVEGSILKTLFHLSKIPLQHP